MKKTILKVFCFVVLTVLAMCINTRTVRADVYTSSRNADMGTYASDTNYFTHSASGSYTTHTKWRYGLFDSNHNLMGAWCVQAHVQYIVGQTYETTVGYQVLDERTGAMMSYIILHGGYNDQEKQAAIWGITDGTAGLSAENGGDLNRVYNLINEASNAYVGGGVCRTGNTASSVSFNSGSLSYNYVEADDAFESNEIIASVGGSARISFSGPNGSYMLVDGGRQNGEVNLGGGNHTIKIVCPRTQFKGTHATSINAHSDGGSGTEYYGATEYHVIATRAGYEDYTQILVTPNSGSYNVPDTNISVSGNVSRPVGNLAIQKIDEHNVTVAGVRFHITGPYHFDEYITSTKELTRFTDVDIGTYTITELEVVPNLILDSRALTIGVEENKTATYTMKNNYAKGSSDMSKGDEVTGKIPLGDAKLEGAIYELRANEDIYEGETLIYTKDQLVDTRTTDSEGNTTKIENLPMGNYYWIETKAPVGYNLNDRHIEFTVEYEGQNVPKVTNDHMSHTDKIITGKVEVIKEVGDPDSSESSLAVGAILKLTLDSNPTQTYEGIINEEGKAEFRCETLNQYGIYTIPFGKYTITEVKGADGEETNDFFIQPEPVDIDKEEDDELRIVSDEPVPVWLKIVKKDKSTGDIVPLSGAKFKIWDVDHEKWVVMSDMYNDISEFVTNEDGYLFTPKQLYPGNYIVYETQAPEGYYLQDEWRIPDNPNDLGDKTKGGKFITINKVAARVPENIVDPGPIEVGQYMYEVSMPDNPLYVNIQLYKTGEILTGSHTENVSYAETDGEVVELEKYVADYTVGGLEGVSFKIYADEDIYTPDGVLRVRKDTEVGDITTDEDGYAYSDEDLFPGKYRVEEYAVPEGYVLDTTPKYVPAENKDQYVESATATLEINDVRQKLKYTFEKIFEQFKYTNGSAQKHAVFGIYTKESIKAPNGNVIINAGELVDLLEADDDTLVKTTDLPKGKYYVKELYVTYPYLLSSEEVDFELVYKPEGNEDVVELEGPEIINEVEYGYARAIKVSTSTDNGLITLNKKTITSDNFKRRMADMATTISTMDRTETENYIEAEKIKTVSDAEYELWLDEEGKSKLMEVNPLTGEQTVAKFTSDNIGVLELYELPKGEYFLKEVKAPQKYEIAKRAVPLAITASNPEAAVYEVVIETPLDGVGVHKTDIFTGEDVPNCKFEVRDSENNLLMYAVTDEDGYAHIPEDMFEEGKTYTYTEIEAPDVYKEDGKLYKLNTEPHEFVAHFDEDGHFVNTLIEIENYRPTTNVKFVKTDEESNLVPNCKFELKSEEEGLYYETGVTDENGIYVFEDVPQGWYTYTELEAPEEYDLDTTPHRVYVTGDEMVIDFVNTGDIPVVAIACLAIACVAGISFITVRKVKATK